MKIRQLLKQRPLIFDGAMGTMIQKSGLELGKVPEMFNFRHPEIIKDIYRQYLIAGSDIISTNTFGANRLKSQGCGYTVQQIISKAVGLAKEAVYEYEKDCLEKGEKYVALALGPIGKLMQPTGELEFEEVCDLYREQVIPGIEAGADLILIETQSDLHELKAAIVTVRELTDLPLFVTVTFQEDGRMLMGSDPLTFVTMVQDLAVDALGVNCSLGPEQMLAIVEEIVSHSKIPVMVQPNAGMPKMVGGETRYDVDEKTFATYMEKMLFAGALILGGCCGTSPAYIKELVEGVRSIDHTPPARQYNSKGLTVCSARKTLVLDGRIRVIGERINPTGKKLLKEALKKKDYSYIENEALAQVRAGADILDVNVGLPGTDEKELMINSIKCISAVTDAPLQIDSADPQVVEAAVRYYNGRPIINSVNGKQEVMDAIFPIAKKYGACLIALTLDEKGLPANAKDRVDIAERILNEAKKYGISRDRILIDCLTLTVSAQQEAGIDTLKAMRIIKDRFGVRMTLGTSNVSFGLPERRLLNNTFLAMALNSGLDAPITDPLVVEYMDTIRAFEALTARDVDSRDYIACYGGKAEKPAQQPARGQDLSQEDRLKEIILDGLVDRSAQATRELLKHLSPLDIVENVIIPSLSIVGKEYETGDKFLPQLVQSADAVKPAFQVIKEAMTKEGQTINYGEIILATVKGDIHDIGKNIVKVLLENYGYEVLDLGKDADIQLIVETVKSKDIKLVGLSALMTTTVVNMAATIKELRKAKADCKIAVGGAVLTREYAADIGADFYCKDAMDGVRVANRIFREEK